MPSRFYLLALLGALAACSDPSNTAPAPAAATVNAPTAVVGTPAPGSKFSRVKIGMGKTEVQDLIGPPNDQNSHITGKVFIPLYFGSGTTEIDAHYKGEGILTYASRGVGSTSYELIGMTVDRNESGYVR